MRKNILISIIIAITLGIIFTLSTLPLNRRADSYTQEQRKLQQEKNKQYSELGYEFAGSSYYSVYIGQGFPFQYVINQKTTVNDGGAFGPPSLSLVDIFDNKKAIILIPEFLYNLLIYFSIIFIIELMLIKHRSEKSQLPSNP